MFSINRRLLLIGLVVLLLGVIAFTLYFFGLQTRQQSAPQPATTIPTTTSVRLPDQLPAMIQNAVSEAGLALTATIVLPIGSETALSATPQVSTTPDPLSTSINPFFRTSIFQTEEQPGYLIRLNEATIRSGGPLWPGVWNPSSSPNTAVHYIALIDTTAWIEADCGATTAAGVQFFGDQNDGWARIIVDQQFVWTGNTWGGAMAFDKYVEFVNLPLANHTLRVEATGEPGTPGGSAQVTLAGFGCGPVLIRANKVYLPLVILL